MCECGCGEFHPRESYKIGDRVLSIEVYPGCRGCQNAMAVTLHWLTPEEAAEWGVTDPPTLDLDGLAWRWLNVQLFDASDLLEWLRRNPEAIDGYASVPDFMADHGLELLQGALAIRAEKAGPTRG